MRRSILLGLMLTGASLLAVAPLASAQVYKWVDSKGVVHFAQTPPPAGVKFQLLNVATDTLSNPTGAASAVAPADAAAVGVPDNAQRQQPAPSDTPANRAKLCQQLQQNLTLLDSQEALNVAGPDGKPVALSAPQRAVQKATTQAQIKQYCSAPAQP